MQLHRHMKARININWSHLDHNGVKQGEILPQPIFPYILQ